MKILICILAFAKGCLGAAVSDVQPRQGSLGGETRLTIYGSGFSANQFSQNDDPNTGNKVYLVSSSGSEYECPVHKDGTTEIQIMCYTPQAMREEDHYVKVVVNGARVPDSSLCNGNPTANSCTYKPRSRNTPTIASLEPQSGFPGEMVTMTGKLFTDRYGSNLASATNGKTEKLLRVYVGPQDCGLKENDEFYGLALNDENTDDGVLMCKTKGSSVGFHNASFIVESPYGRSMADANLYRVSYNDRIYLYQFYTDISNISHSMGSTAGGLSLTINGNFFDDRAPYTAPRAYVGDTECVITNVVTDANVECTVAAEPQYSHTKFSGNRGANFEYWTGRSFSLGDLDSILSLSSLDGGYGVDTIDETYFFDVNNTIGDDYASRITTHFKPPHSGEYQFYLLADDAARLYVDGVSMVTSQRRWEASARQYLDEKTEYLLEITHYERGGDSYIHLKAKFYDTQFTSSWTGKAEQETQTISITSTVKYDVQELEFQQFSGQTHGAEVQTVTVDSAGDFRFGLFGVFTEPLNEAMTEAMIQTALGELPIWGTGETVGVVRNPTTPPSYELTFDSKRGDFPDIEVIGVPANSSSVTYSVTEDVKGVPDLNTVALMMEGIVSTPFSVASVDAGGMASAVKSMFEAKCPKVFSNPSKAIHYDSFESASSTFIGSIVKDTDAFCGRYAIKNPYRIYRKLDDDLGILLLTHGTACFAYKGFLSQMIGIRFSYRDAVDLEVYTQNHQFSYNFHTDSQTESNSWYYTCVDMYSVVYDLRPTDFEHRLDEIWVYRASGSVDAYVDSLFVGSEATTTDQEAHLRRLPPAQPNGAFINDVSVSMTSGNIYEVTLIPFDCGYDFSLFELANGKVASGGVTSSSNSATLALSNGGGSGVVRVTRTSEASPPVTGLIDVTFNGKTRSRLNVSLEAADFDRELESLEGIGSVSVVKQGDCANFDMITTFLTLPGDLPQMSVTYGQLSGIDAVGSIVTNTDGGLFYDPLTGDMVSTVHSQPQVRLYINDVPSSCSGDCSFRWDSSVTPTITSVSPNTGSSALGTSITIVGTGFSSVTSENIVTIGGVACSVTAATSTSITCDVGNGPVGFHSVLVTVQDKGYASGNVQFSYGADVLSISPTSGSLGGGGNLTISGYGFDTNGVNVTINALTCNVISVKTDEIICIVPNSNTGGAFNVVVNQGSSSLSFSGYTYDNGLTATVSSVVPSSIKPTGDNVVISGSSFTSSAGKVYVGTEEATVVSWSDTQIEIEVHDIDAGVQDIKIDVNDGLAVDSTSFLLPKVNVELQITNVFPLQGSVLGGTQLTITGSGFGTNASIVDVNIGSVDCAVSGVSNTEIVCDISQAGFTHHITNKGIDPAFGVYYAFDKPYITIQEGDFVQWTWETPIFVNDIAHAIIEVDSPSSTTQKVGGFNSGIPSRNGQYRYQFNQAGIYYVWSGFVDIWGIKNYAGTIEVVPASSSAAEVVVQVGKARALHDVGGASDPVDSSLCQSVTTGKSGCSDPSPSGSDSNKFSFGFWSCSTPIVDTISVNNGTTKTAVTVTGEGFSTTPCQNEVTFGGYACVVTAATETSLTCQLAKSGEPELGILHQIAVRVANRGNALIRITEAEDRGFAVMPNIDGITPTSGSMAGGAHLTITGFGFGDLPLVTIGGVNCPIIEQAYDKIICETPASSMDVKDVEAFAYVNGVPLPAVCETSSEQCQFSYAPLFTPTLLSITPSTHSTTGVETFTISGLGFGNVTSDIAVTIGGEYAIISQLDNSNVVVTIDDIPVGSNDVQVRVRDYGRADGSLSVTRTASITSITPSSGSTYGETTITIQGEGFVVNDTTVNVDGSACTVQTTTLSEVTCITAPHAAGSVSVDVTSKGISYPSDTFSYATGSTPTVSSVSPLSGFPGDTLSISGSNFAGGAVTVFLGQSACVVTSSSSTLIECTVGNHATGNAAVYVHIDGLGASNTDVEFEYQLSITSISPTQGGIAGGQTVTISGTGFDTSAVVTICGVACNVKNVTSSEYSCKTPAASAQTCDVTVSLNGLTKTLSNAYTYDVSLTPDISGVSPSRGGTGGGTTITISGSGFGTTLNDVSVEIDGTSCVATSVTDSEIQCVTGAHAGSVVASIEVQIAGNGIAQESFPGDSEFEYIDVWSSPFTWGGGPLPQAGEFVVIPAGMTLLLDMDTPVLSFLLIQGGRLIFDEKDIELQSNTIMITDGGALQVGTEDQPFQHKAIITLHGHHRSRELPIYGTKVLAVRNGTLDLHGIEVPLTWTRLDSTAAAGTNTLSLVDPVEWNVGDEIVIASTGHRHTQSENEKKKISAISVDKRTLTLDSNLEAEHVGTQETFDGTLVEFRAEVGLLTHNVVVRGNQDPQWEDEIEECKAGFNTGEFAVQTCFLGRFGDEIGSSQFGAMILVHAPVKDTHEAQARISYTEVTFAGQAFRLGRYPIHFHLNGDMSTSYVRGCSIHKAFNRAVNIHGTHNTLVEKTVIYDIMGGAFFLEDGIETGNTLQYNLAVFVIGSSSLLNDDVTPASFWVTNPNNTIQHNAAAGGTHFGYWYRMHQHPDGPSFTPNVCPQNVPLGVFRNNSAHSFGWFGLWIFESYFPMKDSCNGGGVEPAVFESLFAWNNDKGAEAVNAGALQFVDFVLVQNKLAGYEGKKIIGVPHYTDESPMVKDSLIVGKTTVIPSGQQGCTRGGIVLPFGRGFRVVNVRFVNFADSSCAAFGATRITGTCSFLCGGYIYHTEQLSFINSPNKFIYAWDWEAILFDRDGTATGKPANWTILPTSGTLPSDCEPAPEFSLGVPASVCPPQYKWHRFAFNNIQPKALEGKSLIIVNEYGNSTVQFAKKRLTHKPGWMCALVGGASYNYYFENAKQIENISFTGDFYDFESDNYIFIRLKVRELPDRFTIDGGHTYINATTGGLDPSMAHNGDWEWDNVNNEIKFVVHGRQRSKRATSSLSFDRPFSFSSFKCYYKDCIPPPDPNTIPPAPTRPLSYDYWDDTSIWNMTDGYMTNIGENGTGLPQDYDNVRILYETWVLVNMTAISKLGTLVIEGVLEFADTPGAVYNIEADFIIIRGGRLIIGWPDDPFDGLATITLRGNHSSPYFNAGTGPTLGSKAIGVFGGLDLFGKDVGATWTELGATANAGSNRIVLKEQVGWSAGDDIVLGSSSFDPWQTESFRIVSIDADNVTLTLNDSLRYKHTAHYETLSNGEQIAVGAAVGLLTHNIRIIGEDYSDLYQESFGARVLVGLVVDKGQVYSGYARVSNVEFYHTGQEGFTAEYDPRFSIAYVAAGTVSEIKPSIVTKCSFHNGFNTAVGAFGIGSLNITDNVVFGSIGHGIHTTSNDTKLVNNLVALMVATASYMDRLETFNPRWEAGIEAMGATELYLQDNLVTASERIGYHVPLLACNDTSGRYNNNKAYSNLIGVFILPGEVDKDASCVKMNDFTVWKSHDFGLYYQDGLEFLSENNMLIENNNGMVALITGPASLSHVYADKRVNVRHTTFVGQTSSFDCSNDKAPVGDDNFILSANSRPSFGPDGGMVGLVFPNYNSGGNGAPLKPFRGAKNYNAIGGLTTLSDVTFAKFSNSGCKKNFAVTPNSGSDDGQHPIHSERVTMIDVDENNKIFYQRPNIGKINSADCVDMDCDAFKKVLFKDLDGTFLGHVGAVIPESEFEWNGDPRRGLGDYRIPKEMVTELDGTRIPYRTLAPHLGVIRNDNCTYRSSWQAYVCMEDINHEMLIIESMDSDTETRRLSPVAILGDGYIDLINGPQDHGWCSGYTCRKRISTFMALVATDKDYLLHFTSTTPEHMRYRLLNVDPSEGIKLTVWYSRPNRLDVFVDGVFKIATNARIDSNNRYIMTMPKGNEFEPQIANGTGTNFFDKDRGEITFIIQGPQVIDVISQETIIVSFGLPALTVTEFYGDNIVENLAAFLNIPLTKVRIMNVVSAASSGRKRRSITGITVEIEIGDEPSSDINSTVSDSIDYTQLLELASELVNECQVGNISHTLNMTGGCETVELPSTDPSVGTIVYHTPSPDHMFFYTEPEPLYEGVPLKNQPKIRVADISNNVITELGTAEHPWQVTVSIRAGTGHPNANLSGTLSVNGSDGWFNFTDLAISHMGSGYILDFNVTYPIEAENFTLESAPIDVAGRPLKINVYDHTSGDILKNGQFAVTLDLRDSNTGEIITDISWRQHTWSAEARILGSSSYASLSGTPTSTFDLATGRVMFPDLALTGFGIFYVQFRVTSNPPDFNLTLNHKMAIKNPAHIGMTIEEQYEVKVKFKVDFDKVLPTEDKQNEFEQMILTEYANIWPDVQLSVGSISEGSIIVTFVIAGSYSDVNATAYSLCDSIYNGTQYAYNGYTLTLAPFMTINNQTYYGVTCGEIEEDDDDERGLAPYLIAIIVILSLILVAAVAGIIIWRCAVKPKTKTHDFRSGTVYIGNEGKPIEDFLFREETFASMGFNSGQAPAATNLGHGGEKRPMSSFSMRINTPEPVNMSKMMPLRTGDGYLSPPPTYYDSAATYVEPGRGFRRVSPENTRSPSPSGTTGSQSPRLSRSHSPFLGSDSPLPPVGEDLYHSEYITTPVPRSTTPHLPAPSPTPSPSLNRRQ